MNETQGKSVSAVTVAGAIVGLLVSYLDHRGIAIDAGTEANMQTLAMALCVYWTHVEAKLPNIVPTLPQKEQTNAQS